MSIDALLTDIVAHGLRLQTLNQRPRDGLWQCYICKGRDDTFENKFQLHGYGTGETAEEAMRKALGHKAPKRLAKDLEDVLG